MVEAAQRSLQNGTEADPSAVLQQLHKRIEEAGVFKEINSSTKDFHSSVSKLGKALEKAFDLEVDLCKALRPVQMDQTALCQVIAEHFYRQGRFALGDAVAAEAGLAGPEALRAPYADMHAVLEQIRARNLAPALRWAEAHRAALCPEGGPAPFEFRLHSLAFVHALQTQGKAAALAYAKRHFAPHAGRHLRDIQRLMGCLAFYTPDTAAHTAHAARDGDSSNPAAQRDATATASTSAATQPAAPQPSPSSPNPYADLLSPGAWDAAAAEFSKAACHAAGAAADSPLAVVAAAGAVALPLLLKMAAVLERNGQDLRTCEQLPGEIELGPQFVFRSIFACPVSREMSTPDNPPTLLPCGHVLCEQSVAKLAKSRPRGFKCPYCPQEARLESCRPLVLPA